MSDARARPPSKGWYAIGGDPNDLAYFDGQLWTWRGARDPGGAWHQQPISPPTATVPSPAVPPAAPPGALPGPPPGHLALSLSEPEPQARWTTLLRGLLVVPNLVVLAFLQIAVLVITIPMWFAALFTARVPEALWCFSVDVLKWQARTYAYTFFLTDRYPPFKPGDVAYPVSIALDGPPDRFNRLSVLFRVILIIPALVVVGVFSYGVEIFSIVTWLLTLVRGRCPRPLHLLVAAWLRYSVRVSAFQLLLTTEYPSRPLGDPPPAYGAASLGNGDIVLTGSTRGLAIATMVVGAIAYIGSPAVQAAFSATPVAAQRAISQLNALESRSITAATKYREQATSCSPATWTCLRDATPVLLRSLDRQISGLEAITFPTPTTRRDADALVVALRRERDVVTRMAHAASSQALRADLARLTAVTRRLQPLAKKLADDLDAIR